MAFDKTMSAPPWLTQVAMALCALVAYGYRFSRPNIFNQMPAVMALLDPTLYSQDFYVQEMTQFTPRSYYYYALALLVKLGLGLPVVCFIYFAIAFAGFSLGLYAIGRHLGQSHLAAATLAFLGLAVADGTVGFNFLFQRSPAPSAYAIGIAIWGIYFCLQQRWVRGYGLLGVSCLLQFLIGILPGVLLTPALIIHSVREKRWRQVLWAWGVLLLLAGLVYSPMVLSGNTGSDLFSDADFIWLYGYVRHPHHIILSSFPGDGWLRFLYFLLAGVACLYGSQRLQAHHKITLGCTLLTGCGLLAIGYVFVELYPVATVAKLQFARVTPFMLLMSLAAIAVYASDQYDRGHKALALLLIVTPVIDNLGALLTLIVVLLTVLPLRWKELQPLDRWLQKSPWVGYTLFAIILTVTYTYHLVVFLSFAYPFLVNEFPITLKRLRLGAYVVTAASAVFVMLHLGGVVSHRSLGPFHRAIKLEPLVDKPVKALAVRFREDSPKDALVLVPPSELLFRYYSQRSVVANFKGYPFTDAGMVTWQQRMEDLVGPLTANLEGSLTQRFQQQTSSDVAAIAAKYGATHILTHQDWHPEIPGTVVEQQENWVLWDVTARL
ncbi:MAG: DUF6798 domain-containing protein [Cyanobacteria bacterium P01_D01_bin.156]